MADITKYRTPRQSMQENFAFATCFLPFAQRIAIFFISFTHTFAQINANVCAMLKNSFFVFLFTSEKYECNNIFRKFAYRIQILLCFSKKAK